MKIFALLSSAAIAAPTLNSSLKDMYMLSMLENGNVNPFMFSLLGKNSGDSSLWKEYLELNLLTQGQIGTGNFHTANMLNKARFQIGTFWLAQLIRLSASIWKPLKIPAGQTASSLIKELTPIHMLQQMSGKPNDGVIFDSEANPMTTMYMGGAFDNLNLSTGLFGKK